MGVSRGIKCRTGFLKRWLNTPETVRQTYQEDLARICDLLLPQTQIKHGYNSKKKLSYALNNALIKLMPIKGS